MTAPRCPGCQTTLGVPTATYKAGKVNARALCPGCFGYAATAEKTAGGDPDAAGEVRLERVVLWRAVVSDPARGWAATVTLPEDGWAWESISEA